MKKRSCFNVLIKLMLCLVLVGGLVPQQDGPSLHSNPQNLAPARNMNTGLELFDNGMLRSPVSAPQLISPKALGSLAFLFTLLSPSIAEASTGFFSLAVIGPIEGLAYLTIIGSAFYGAYKAIFSNDGEEIVEEPPSKEEVKKTKLSEKEKLIRRLNRKQLAVADAAKIIVRIHKRGFSDVIEKIFEKVRAECPEKNRYKLAKHILLSDLHLSFKIELIKKLGPEFEATLNWLLSEKMQFNVPLAEKERRLKKTLSPQFFARIYPKFRTALIHYHTNRVGHRIRIGMVPDFYHEAVILEQTQSSQVRNRILTLFYVLNKTELKTALPRLVEILKTSKNNKLKYELRRLLLSRVDILSELSPYLKSTLFPQELLVSRDRTEPEQPSNNDLEVTHEFTLAPDDDLIVIEDPQPANLPLVNGADIFGSVSDMVVEEQPLEPSLRSIEAEDEPQPVEPEAQGSRLAGSLITMDDIEEAQHQPSDLEIPGYTEVKKIAEGAMGSIYTGRRRGRQLVAIKVAKRKGFNQLLVTEARILREQNHTNIIKPFEVDKLEDGRYYIAMPLAETTLGHKLKKESIPTPEAKSILLQMAQALQHIHAKGIVHRDLKPPNILINSQAGELIVKVADFGIASQQNQPDQKGRGQIVGTIPYMSPEQLRERKTIEADIYSLGIILFEILYGVRPTSNIAIVDSMEQKDALAGKAQKVLQMLTSYKKVPSREKWNGIFFGVADAFDFEREKIKRKNLNQADIEILLLGLNILASGQRITNTDYPRPTANEVVNTLEGIVVNVTERVRINTNDELAKARRSLKKRIEAERAERAEKRKAEQAQNQNPEPKEETNLLEAAIKKIEKEAEEKELSPRVLLETLKKSQSDYESQPINLLLDEIRKKWSGLLDKLATESGTSRDILIPFLRIHFNKGIPLEKLRKRRIIEQALLIRSSAEKSGASPFEWVMWQQLQEKIAFDPGLIQEFSFVAQRQAKKRGEKRVNIELFRTVRNRAQDIPKERAEALILQAWEMGLRNIRVVTKWVETIYALEIEVEKENPEVIDESAEETPIAQPEQWQPRRRILEEGAIGNGKALEILLFNLDQGDVPVPTTLFSKEEINMTEKLISILIKWFKKKRARLNSTQQLHLNKVIDRYDSDLKTVFFRAEDWIWDEESYVIGFNNGTHLGIAIDFIQYIFEQERFSYRKKVILIGEYLFHELHGEAGIDHKNLYTEVQHKTLKELFGEENPLKEVIRGFITSKQPQTKPNTLNKPSQDSQPPLLKGFVRAFDFSL